MAFDSDWLPSLISAGALGIVWVDIRRCKAEMNKETKDLGKRVKLLEDGKPKKYFEDVMDEYMSKEDHELLCKNKGQEFTITLMKSIQALKDEIFPELRAIHDAVKDRKNNK